jgi:hypothetical protein
MLKYIPHNATNFLGRNGYFIAIGINVSIVDGIVLLNPVTSKGEQGRAQLEIPKKAIPDLIAALQEAQTSK